MKKILSILAASLLLFSGCDKYLDVNQNPNNATSANPSLVLPAVLRGVADEFSTYANDAPANWMGYWAYADGWSGWFDIKQYQITSTYFNNFFNVPYQDYLQDATYIENSSTAPEDGYYRAIAKIVKGMVFQVLVDAYGDIPYSQACSGYFSPAYDDAQTIYEDLVNQMDTAVKLIDETTALPLQTLPGNSDIMFNGDMTKWRQLANTVKLKLLLRQSQIPGRDAYITQHLNGLTAADFLSSDALINPGFSSSKPQPMYANWGWTVAGQVTDARTQEVMNAFIFKIYSDLNDLRMFRTFDPAVSQVKSCTFKIDTVVRSGHGLSDGDEIYFTTSGTLPPEIQLYTPYYVSVVDANQFQISDAPGGTILHNSTTGSGSNNYYVYADAWSGKPFGYEGNGLTNPWNKDNGNLIGGALIKKDVTNANGSLVLGASQSFFLQAEAAQRGWLTSVDAKTMYNNGISASFQYLGLSGAQAAAYMKQKAVSYDSAAVANRLNLILMQKYISLCGISGFEAWCDYRRTGVPDPKASDPNYSMLTYYIGTPRREVPLRFPYIQREYSLNNVNTLAAAKKAYGKDPDNSYQWTPIFWDK